MPNAKVLSEKQAVVAELVEKLKGAASGVLVDYKGITVAEDTALRAELRKNDVEYAVVKNTLTRFAAQNAGLGELDNVADSTWPVQSRMVDLNCRALTAVTTVVLPHMERGGFIVNVCSIASFCPNTRMTVYSSTKAYVMSFTKGLREELRPLGINALAVCPGPMKTEFLDVANITDRSPMFKTLPYSDPDAVADKAMAAAAKGRCVYTHLFLFKLYRVLAKLLPHNLMMKFCKT